MKKNLVKTMAIGSLLLGLGSAGLFAQGMKGCNCPAWNNGGNQKICRQNLNQRKTNQDLRHPVWGKGQGKNDVDLAGTVSKVEPEKGTLKIKDADGKEHNVHVNPVTRVKEIAPKAEGNKGPGKAAPKDLLLADIKIGDFAMVMKLGGDTETLEAGKIKVAK